MERKDYMEKYKSTWENINKDFPNVSEPERLKKFMEIATAEEITGYYIATYHSQAHFVWITDVRKQKNPTKRDFQVTALFHALVMAG